MGGCHSPQALSLPLSQWEREKAETKYDRAICCAKPWSAISRIRLSSTRTEMFLNCIHILVATSRKIDDDDLIALHIARNVQSMGDGMR